MVMLPWWQIDEILMNRPDRGSVEYRNAWATVRSRLKSASKPNTISRLQAVEMAMLEIGLPLPATSTMTREAALARGREVSAARAIGRCKAALMRRLEAARWGVLTITDAKPFVWEAALQMIEDGEIELQRASRIGDQGPRPAGEKGTRIWVMKRGSGTELVCPWTSERNRKAGEVRI